MSSIKVSFCIPIMNRLKDLQATLKKNLEDNRIDSNFVEFIVLSFDKNDLTKKWVLDNFEDDLKSGYLKFHSSNMLDTWHFGKAKNAFKGLMSGEIYSSLDGDNYTGYRAGKHIYETFKKYKYKCIFHQFQGDWGDGTCGRVSINRQDYLNIGYDEDFMPRQWDELDAMLSILANDSNTKYICYKNKSIFKKSGPFNRFFTDHKIKIDQIELNEKDDPLFLKIQQDKISEGQHNNNYVRDDSYLRLSSIFNHLSSYIKNSTVDSLKNKYVAEIVDVQRKLIDQLDKTTLLKCFLLREDNRELSLAKNDIIVVSCIKNEKDILQWYNHYKKIGVNKFLLIDDNSDFKLIESLPYDDVYVWKPICGEFRYSKAFWLEVILSNFAINKWVLTVDSDEYISIPSIFSNEKYYNNLPLTNVIKYAEENNKKYFCGFLLDVFPSSKYYDSVERNKIIPQNGFTNFQYRNTSNNHFVTHKTSIWSYGKFSDWACLIDIRYRINGTVDSLRKFPLIKYEKGFHLNQGFHDLIINNVKRSSTDLEDSVLLPIIHYKLYVTQYDADASNLRSVEQYHHETKVNLISLRNNIRNHIKQACISPFSYKYFDYWSVPLPRLKSVSLIFIKKSNDFDVVDILNKKIPVLLNQKFTNYVDGVLYAKSINECISWFVENTPFKYPCEKNGEFILSSERDIKSNISIVNNKEERAKISFYRIIGNSLPGLHSSEQNLINLEHILKNETNFSNVEKIFVLNKLLSVEEKKKIIKLLDKYSYKYFIIEFSDNEFSSLGYSLDRLPSSSCWFEDENQWNKLCYKVAIRETKNRFLMNNNGARNYCLEKGKVEYDWIFPWDGNSFLSDAQFKEIKQLIDIASKSNFAYKYIAVPMERVIDNQHIDSNSVSSNHDEEPQIIFHKSTLEKFNDFRVYGNQPKVELFKRLGYRGKWDSWLNLYPWEPLTFTISKESGTVKEGSSVFRLYSGNLDALQNSNNRAKTRFSSIVSLIDDVEAEFIFNEFNLNNIIDIVIEYLSRQKLTRELKNLFDLVLEHESVSNFESLLNCYDMSSNALKNNFNFALLSILFFNKGFTELNNLIFILNNFDFKFNYHNFINEFNTDFYLTRIIQFFKYIFEENRDNIVGVKVEIIMMFYYTLDNNLKNQDIEFNSEFIDLLILTENIFKKILNYSMFDDLRRCVKGFKDFKDLNCNVV